MNTSTSAIIMELIARPENQTESGDINWDFVSSDLHIEFPEVMAGVDIMEEERWFSKIAKRIGATV